MAIDLRSHAATAPNPAAVAPHAVSAQPLMARIFAGGGISAGERMLFTERLALLLDTGMALHNALDLLRRQAGSLAMQRTLAAILEEVVGGKPLSAALARHPEVFPGAYVSLIRAAESGGFVPQVLTQILEMEDKQQKLRAMLVGAVTYPAFLALFSAGVVLFVLVGVFPKFAEMFDAIRNQLPLSTVVLMAASDLLRQHWLPIGAGSAAAALPVAHWARGAAGKAAIDRFKLRLPLLRGLFVQVYMIRLMRVMSASLGNGVSVLDTLQASRETIDNGVFRAFMLRVEDRVIQGGGMAAAFCGEPFIPELIKQMLSTGEETGKLAMVMGRIAEYYERELARRTTAVAKMIEPAMLVLMGGGVGLIVVSLILPIFKLAKAVN